MFYNERQRHELFVGIFRKDAWTCSQLRDYFHRLIPQSVIHHCQITPSYSATHPGSFEMISMVFELSFRLRFLFCYFNIRFDLEC